jgi:hypothetical protein
MTCTKKKERHKDNNTDEYQRKLQERLLKKLLNQKNEEEVKIHKARAQWSIIRRKIKVIRMMSFMGGS